MLQTGHNDRQSVPNTIETVNHSLAATPKMPVLIGEVCYEGIAEASRQEVQRFMFWSAILSGTGGHTYGANGIWQVNTRQQPYGLSPHGHSWGGPAWDIAAQLPGSGQLGLAKGLLTRYSWWKLEPRPELVEPRWSTDRLLAALCGPNSRGSDHRFSPSGVQTGHVQPSRGGNLPGVFLQSQRWRPRCQSASIQPDTSGRWKPPEFPIFRDWVIVLEHKA